MADSQGGDTSNENIFKLLSRIFEALGESPVLSRLTIAKLLIGLSTVSGVSGLAVVGNQLMGSSEPTPDFPPSKEEIAGYTEEQINIKSACNDEEMIAWATSDLKQKYELAGETSPEPLIIKRNDITTELSPRTDLWPVYRWRCFYKSDRYTSAPLGLDLQKYCKQKYSDEDYSFGYTNYLEPESFVCTRIDNSANLPRACEADLNSTRQSKAIYSDRRLFE